MSETPTAPVLPRPRPLPVRLLRLLLVDLKTKALALAFAVLVWMYVDNEITTEVRLAVPIAVSAASPRIMITDVSPPEVRLHLQGPREKLSLVRAERIAHRLRLDADLLAEGETSKVIERLPEHFYELPSGVTLRNRPRPIRITVVRSLTRTLKVQLKTRGTLAKGYAVTDVRLEPNEVRIRGPMSVMQQHNRIATQPIDIDGRGASRIATFVEVAPRLGEARVQYLEEKRIFVRLKIEKIALRQTRPLAGRKVQLRMPAGFGYTVQRAAPSSVTVVLEGPRAALDIAANEMQVYIQLDELTDAELQVHHKQATYPLHIDRLPPGCKLVKFLAGDDATERVVVEMRPRERE